MNQLLTSNLWKEAAKLARKAKQRQAAIAYVTSEQIEFGKGDVLVTDASTHAIRNGQTSAKVLQAAFCRGAEIWSCPRLHAKVMVLDECAIIGSANLSQSSADVLEECAVLTWEPKLVGQARAFLQQLCDQSKRLNEAGLKKLAALPVVRRRGPKLGKRQTRELGNRCWIIGVSPLKKELSDREKAARSHAESEAASLSPSSRENLDWVRLVGNSEMRKEAKAGDRVIMVWGNNARTKRLFISNPVTLLSRADENSCMFFCFDECEANRRPKLGKTEFSELLKGAGIDVEPTPRMVREMKPEVFDALERDWPEE